MPNTYSQLFDTYRQQYSGCSSKFHQHQQAKAIANSLDAYAGLCRSGDELADNLGKMDKTVATRSINDLETLLEAQESALLAVVTQAKQGDMRRISAAANNAKTSRKALADNQQSVDHQLVENIKKVGIYIPKDLRQQLDAQTMDLSSVATHLFFSNSLPETIVVNASVVEPTHWPSATLRPDSLLGGDDGNGNVLEAFATINGKIMLNAGGSAKFILTVAYKQNPDNTPAQLEEMQPISAEFDQATVPTASEATSSEDAYKELASNGWLTLRVAHMTIDGTPSVLFAVTESQED